MYKTGRRLHVHERWHLFLNPVIIILFLVIPIFMATGAYSWEIRKYKREDLTPTQLYDADLSMKLRDNWKLIAPPNYTRKTEDPVRVIITIDRIGKLQKIVFDEVSDNSSVNISVSNLFFKCAFDPPPLKPGMNSYTLIFEF